MVEFKFKELLPDALLIGVFVLLCVWPTKEVAYVITVASALWAVHYSLSRPEPVPPPVEEERLAELEKAVADLTKAVESVKAAAGMRQLR